MNLILLATYLPQQLGTEKETNLYSLMANNFLAEVPEFFLPNGQLTSIVSKKTKRYQKL
jgi:hypothetical protein